MALEIYSQEELKSIFLDVVSKQKRHTHYQHTVDKAALYYSIMTGEGQEEYILTIKDKETKKQKDRRMKFHHPRTKSIANRIVSEFDELDRNENTVDVIKYESQKNGAKNIDDLNKFMSCFAPGASAKEYLIHRVKELNFFDPNAFIVVEQKDGYSYPIEIYSHQVFDFEERFGRLQYLISFKDVTVNDVKMTEYKMRAPGYGITAIYRGKKQHSFEEFKDTRTTQTPAIRVGYKTDPVTNNKTAVGIPEPATEEFKALMWTGSELDLHKKNHYMLQKFIYAPKCEHEVQTDDGVNKCVGGKLSLTNETCPAGCSNGYAVHRTTSDIVAISKPNNKDEATISLPDMVHYVQVPTALVDGIKVDSQEFEARIVRTIFNAEIFDKTEIMPTATHAGLNKAAKYPAYSKVGKKISQAIVLTVQTTAEYNKLDKGLINHHEFPKDWKLETLEELIALRKSMIDADVAAELIDEIDNRINKMLNRDNPTELLKSKARQNHKPFRHLTNSQKLMIVESLPANHPDRVLFYYFDAIMDDIDADLWKDNLKDPLQFHELTRDKQIQRVKEKTMLYVSEKAISNEPARIGV